MADETGPIPKPVAPLAAPPATRLESRTVRTGFIPLLDAAVLVAAQERGFARREGITLDLVRDVSWSNIRDRLAFRQFDAAHLLGPMAVASQIGVGSNPYPLIAPFALGRGGNAITLSRALAQEIEAISSASAPLGALDAALGLARVIERRRAAGKPPLVFAVVYPFSSHNYEFRYWLACGGIDPDRDVTMTVVPPPLTADALAAGAIDGFCVNAPWNVMAVRADVGRIVAVKADIWSSSPEKVLGVRPEWADANGETLARLIVALDAAARWCDVPANRGELATLLAMQRYVGGDAALIAEILDGDLSAYGPSRPPRHIDDYLTFHAAGAGVPWQSDALWIYSQMVRWGQATAGAEQEASARAAYRPDLYHAALGHPQSARSPRDAKALASNAFLDAHAFDPSDIAAYVAGFPIRRLPVADDFHD